MALPGKVGGKSPDSSFGDHVTTLGKTSGSSNPVAVSIRNLKKHFGEVKAVNGLTVDFRQNEVTSFLGHNGAGKTTTMQILTGLLSPSGGEAYVYGTSVTRDMPKIRSRIGVCPQDNVLFDILTVKEHVLLFGGLRGFEENEINVLEIVAEVGLQDKLDTDVKSLSGGQKRKLQVALSFVGDPAVVFLDEPTAGMDSEARREVWALIGRKKQGRAIVLTTHQMDEAEILGDNIAILDKGVLQEQGTPEELKTRFATGYFIDVAFREGGDRASVLSMIKKFAPGARVDVKELVGENGSPADIARAEKSELSTRSKGDYTIVVPTESSGALSKIFAQLENAKGAGAHGIDAFGVTSTSTRRCVRTACESERRRYDEYGGARGLILGLYAKLPKT